MTNLIPVEIQFYIGLQLVISAILSGIIGIDRERREIHSAGIRTHMVVGVGSCLFTALSIYAFPDGDDGRVAAQIVSGIGFLGTGMIVFLDREVKNLTTAASVWATAGIGMAVGTGAWLLAVMATLTLWFILVYIRQYLKVSNGNNKPHHHHQDPPKKE